MVKVFSHLTVFDVTNGITATQDTKRFVTKLADPDVQRMLLN